jgi:protease secretion system outer membrane protein
MMCSSQMKIYKFIRHYKLFHAALLLITATTVHAVTLEEAMESAMKVDPALRSSKFNLLAAQENSVIARSRLLPQISLQGSSNQLTQTTTQDLPNGSSASRSFTGPSVNHQFVIRQALLRPKELSALRYAELQTQYMELKYQNDVADLKSRVMNIWIDLLGAQQIAQAYERPLPYIKKAAIQERAKYEQGDSTKDATMEAEVQYENAKSSYLQALETLKAKQRAFEKLTRISPLEMTAKKLELLPVTVFVDSQRADVLENVTNRSIELQIAKLQESMQLERIKMAEADHKPTLDLMAAINLAQNDATSTQGYQYKNKQVGVQYTFPLFSGGGISSAVKQAYFVSESSRFETDAVLLKIHNEFDNNWTQLLSSTFRQNVSYVSLKSADEQLKATARFMDLGVKTIGELAIFEASYSRRLVDLIINTQDHLRTKYKLKL